MLFSAASRCNESSNEDNEQSDVGDEETRTGSKKSSEIVFTLNLEAVASLEPEYFSNTPKHNGYHDLNNRDGFLGGGAFIEDGI